MRIVMGTEEQYRIKETMMSMTAELFITILGPEVDM
jgi:hypothetical protein